MVDMKSFIRFGRLSIISNAILCSHVSSRVVVANAMYSASADDSATIVCLMLRHDTGAPLTVTMYPVVDCLVSMHAAQSQSEYAIIPFRAVSFLNKIPLFVVDDRNRKILCNIFICRSVGAWTLLASAQIAKQMSGRVDVAR